MKRVANWWGDKKRYFHRAVQFRPDPPQGNPGRARARLPAARRARPEIRRDSENLERDLHLSGGDQWLAAGARVSSWMCPSGVYGLHMNLEAPIFQNKDFRIAMQHLFNFDRLEPEPDVRRVFPQGVVLRRDRVRQPRTSRPIRSSRRRRANIWSAPAITAPTRSAARPAGPSCATSPTACSSRARIPTTFWSTTRARRRASRSSMRAKGLERHLTVMQQDFRRAGVDMQLQLAGAGNGVRARARAQVRDESTRHDVGGLYPEPRQYLHTEFKNANEQQRLLGLRNARRSTS